MTAWRGGLYAATLLAVVGLAAGCNPLTGTFFFLMGAEDKIPAEFPLAKRGGEVQVVILTTLVQEPSRELLGLERQLTGHIGKKITQLTAYNREKVKIVSSSKVEDYKASHPGWKSLPPGDIAKHFDADYAIDVELSDVTLYEQGSRKSLYRGRANVSVAVYAAEPEDEDDDGAAYRKEFTSEYPRTRGVIPVEGEGSLAQFRDGFTGRIATDISWLFSARVTTDQFMLD